MCPSNHPQPWPRDRRRERRRGHPSRRGTAARAHPGLAGGRRGRLERPQQRGGRDRLVGRGPARRARAHRWQRHRHRRRCRRGATPAPRRRCLHRGALPRGQAPERCLPLDDRGGLMPTVRRDWLVVAEEELRDLWLAGRGLPLTLAFSLVLSVMTYLTATNTALNFLEQRESVNLTLQVAVAVGALLVLLASADALSGERERGTLESLLLSPASRLDLVIGKAIAALSIWLVAIVVS